LFLGSGAETAARAEAARLLSMEEELREHPDLKLLGPGGGGSISIEAVREALAWARYAPLRAGVKVILIGPAEHLTHEAANALLKSLEESPPYLAYVLHATSQERLLPTIRSRCRMIWVQHDPAYWAGKLVAAGYGEEECRYLLELLELDPYALDTFVDERRFPLRELEEAEAELSGLPTEELLERFIAYAGDPIRRRVASRIFLRKLPERPVAELVEAAERLARAGRDTCLRFLAEYLHFLYSEAHDGWRGFPENALRDLQRKVSLAKAEVQANANLRLLLEVVFLWSKWKS